MFLTDNDHDVFKNKYSKKSSTDVDLYEGNKHNFDHFNNNE